MLEYIPFFKLAKNNPLKTTVLKGIKNFVIDESRKVGVQALTEGGTEAIQEVVNNSVARAVWDEDREVLSGVGKSFFWRAYFRRRRSDNNIGWSTDF